MRPILAALLMLASPTRPLEGQVDYYGRVGLTFATKLLVDDVIQEIEVQQSLAPTLALGASLPIAPLYRAGLEGALTSAGYHATEEGVEADLGTLRTGSLLLTLEGPVWRDFSWVAGAGLMRYWPAESDGIFQRGGTTRFLAGAGLDYRPPLTSQWELMVSLRYDFHRFTTEELKARGFSGTQGVQRVSASVGLARARP